MSTFPRLRGAYTALVTPFLPDGSLDEAAIVRLVERQIDGFFTEDGFASRGCSADLIRMCVRWRAYQHRIYFRMSDDCACIICHEGNAQLPGECTPGFRGTHRRHNGGIIEMSVDMLQVDAPDAPDAEESESDHIYFV